MRPTKTLTRLIALLTVVAVTNVTRAGDNARYMRRTDTAIYIGWSQLMESGSPELATQQKGLNASFGDWLDKNATPDQSHSFLLDALPLIETGSVGIGLFDVVLDGPAPDIQVALVIDAGADSAQLVPACEQLIALTGSTAGLEERHIGSVTMKAFEFVDPPLVAIWGVHKGCFIFTLGQTAAEKVIATMNGDSQNLAGVPELVFDRQKVDAQVDGKYWCVYADHRRIVERAREIVTQLSGEFPPMADALLTELGITSVRSKYVHWNERDGYSRTSGFGHIDGPMRGLLSLWDQQPLTDDDLKVVPADAYWAEVGNLDLSGVWEETLRVVEAASPDALPAVEGSLAMVSGMLGFSITNELLPALGDTWAVFDAPDHGGILGTGTVLVVEVNDADALHGMLSRIVGLLSPMLAANTDVRLAMKQSDFGDRTIHYVKIGGVMSPVAPAWGFANDRWVFGLWPQSVAAAIKHVDPATRGKTLLDNPDYKTLRAQLPAQVQAIGYCDMRYFTRFMYPVGNMVGTLGLSMMPAECDDLDLLEMMPPVADQVADVTSYVGATSTDADGILYIGNGDGALLPAAVAGGAMAVSILLPSLAQARSQAKSAVSMSNLRGIGMACMIYANDNYEKFPDSFDVLLEQGFITQKQLQSPADDDDAGVSYIYIAGQNAGGDLRNIVAYERLYDGADTTNVLFLDAHVERMTVEQFKQRLRETYTRLGREDEIPAEFR